MKSTRLGAKPKQEARKPRHRAGCLMLSKVDTKVKVGRNPI